MQRHANYTYPQMAPTHRYSGTSSAFSPSANPNEDWTKISDLAERRRIQNRIAQRNYRKKLKKRLEDLERRAASNSASPEQRPAELDRSSPQSREDVPALDASVEPGEHSDRGPRTPEFPSSRYAPQQDDRNMFSHQYTRQLSMSPPPFSYSAYPEPNSITYAPYGHNTAYQAVPTTTTPEVPIYSNYLPPLSSAFSTPLPSLVHSIKPDYYGEEEISPFSMSFAAVAGIDIHAQHSYHDSNAQTPPHSDSFEASLSSSPPDLKYFPVTPLSMPGTPPLQTA